MTCLCSRESQNELNSLTNLIESMWSHYEPTVSHDNLNLDEMFSFLQEERGLEASKGHTNKTLDDITDELNELNDLLTQDMVCCHQCGFHAYTTTLLLPSYTLGLGRYGQRLYWYRPCRYDTYSIQYTCTWLKVSKSWTLDFNNKVYVLGWSIQWIQQILVLKQNDHLCSVYQSFIHKVFVQHD